MLERYRKDYQGEFVIVNTTWKDGKKIQEREWVPNPLENKHISKRAVVIGTGASRERFDIKALEQHKGGLLGKLALQTYGAESLYTEITPDFLVVFDSSRLDQLEAYAETNVVYTTTKNCIKRPGKFYMVPFNIRTYALATALYLAAFDGHREVFLVGCDGIDPIEERELMRVMAVYRGTKFMVVSDVLAIPASWRKLPNVAHWNYRQFITECDI